MPPDELKLPELEELLLEEDDEELLDEDELEEEDEDEELDDEEDEPLPEDELLLVPAVEGAKAATEWVMRLPLVACQPNVCAVAEVVSLVEAAPPASLLAAS